MPVTEFSRLLRSDPVRAKFKLRAALIEAQLDYKVAAKLLNIGTNMVSDYITRLKMQQWVAEKRQRLADIKAHKPGVYPLINRPWKRVSNAPKPDDNV